MPNCERFEDAGLDCPGQECVVDPEHDIGQRIVHGENRLIDHRPGVAGRQDFDTCPVSAMKSAKVSAVTASAKESWAISVMVTGPVRLASSPQAADITIKKKRTVKRRTAQVLRSWSLERPWALPSPA